MSTEILYEDEETEQGCGLCARGGGVLLATLGAALLYMGTDLVTGGGLTRALFGAPAGPPAGAADNEAGDTGVSDVGAADPAG